MPSPSDLASLTMADLLRGAGAPAADEPDVYVDEHGRLNVGIRSPRVQRAQIGAGEHGLPYMPPLELSQMLRSGEMRSANSPLGDFVAEKTGQTALGPAVDKVARLGRATGDTVAGMTGANLLPWMGERMYGAGEALSRMVPEELGGNIVATAAAQPAQAETPDEIMALQRKMRDAGLYTGKIDGKRGRETNDAIKAWQADAPKREAVEAARRGQELDAAKNATERERIKAQQAETERQRLRDEETARQAREAEAAQAEQDRRNILGQGKFEEAEKNASIPSQLWRENAPVLGWGVGAGVGHGARHLVTHFANRANQNLAARASEMIANPGAKTWNRRAGDVNDFWVSGQRPSMWPGAGPVEQPFIFDTARVPAFRANPEAPQGNALYQPNAWKNWLQDAGVMGGGLGESVAAHYWLKAPAQEELAKARDAFTKDSSPANLARLQAARDALATGQFAEGIGRGTALGYGTSMPVLKRGEERPNIGAAEGERGQISDWLARQGRTGAGRRPPPQSTPAAGTATPLPGAAPQAPAAQSTARTSPSQGASAPPNVDLPEGHAWAGPSNPTQTRIQGKYGPKLPEQSKPSNKAGKGEQSANPPHNTEFDDLTPYGRAPRGNGRSSDAGGLSELLRGMA